MSLLERFKKLPEVQEMMRQGALGDVANMAYMVGNLNKDEGLRAYSQELTDQAQKDYGPGAGA